MGSFGGHTLPGSFFAIFGVWWTCNIYYTYFLSRMRREKFTSTVSFRCRFLCGRARQWPVEGAVLIFFTAVGGALEIYTAFGHTTSFIHIGNAQHATMFLFFGMTGVIDILLYFRVPLPPGVHYLCAFLSFSIEYLLFSFHLHGNKPVDTLIHTLLLYTILATMAVVLVESYWRHHLLPVLSRAFLVTLQGTWFWQIAFVLYNPNKLAKPWDLESHRNMTIVTLYFAWHVAVLLILTLFVGGLIKLFVDRRHNWRTDEQTGNNVGQYGELSMLDGSESEVEFEAEAECRNKLTESTFP